MKKIVQWIIAAFFFLVFSILIVTAFPAHADETGKIDKVVNNSSKAVKPGSETLNNPEKKKLIEESAFHRFFTRGKDYLALFGQRLNFV